MTLYGEFCVTLKRRGIIRVWAYAAYSSAVRMSDPRCELSPKLWVRTLWASVDSKNNARAQTSACAALNFMFECFVNASQDFCCGGCPFAWSDEHVSGAKVGEVVKELVAELMTVDEGIKHDEDRCQKNRWHASVA